MSTHVVTEFHTKPDQADGLIAELSRQIPDSRVHDGCEDISLRRNEDDPANIISFTRWATRGHYEAYLDWRTARGDTDTVSQFLAQPMSIRYFDEIPLA
jgi:quinol monooxygenase YgiN